MGGDRALAGLAAGRVGLGLLSRAAPRRTAVLFGARETATAELDYMMRVFGARASALASVALTGGYMVVGGARVLRDVVSRVPAGGVPRPGTPGLIF